MKLLKFAASFIIKTHILYPLIIFFVLGFMFFFGRFVGNLNNRLALSIHSITKENKLFRGVILITKNEEIIYEKSYLDRQLSNQQFLVASIAKQVTSALILKEVEKGNIDLYQKANKYLKEDQKINKDISIHHLLTHTSGIIDKQSIKFTPGTRYEYSNYNYIVLGYILKNFTGKYFDELAMALFQNCKMYDSFFINEQFLSCIQKMHSKLAISSILTKGKLENISSERKYSLDSGKKIFFSNPCGGLISTACDLVKWNQALHNEKILSKKTYQEMISKVIKSSFNNSFYGYGLCILDQGEIFHTGYMGLCLDLV